MPRTLTLCTSNINYSLLVNECANSTVYIEPTNNNHSYYYCKAVVVYYILPNDNQLRIDFSIWSQSVEQVLLGYNHNKSL